MPALTTLDDVADALHTRLGQQSVSFGPLVARVVLRTGVDLRRPRPEQVGDPTVIAKVVAALADMGYEL